MRPEDPWAYTSSIGCGYVFPTPSVDDCMYLLPEIQGTSYSEECIYLIPDEEFQTDNSPAMTVFEIPSSCLPMSGCDGYFHPSPPSSTDVFYIPYPTDNLIQPVVMNTHHFHPLPSDCMYYIHTNNIIPVSDTTGYVHGWHPSPTAMNTSSEEQHSSLFCSEDITLMIENLHNSSYQTENMFVSQSSCDLVTPERSSYPSSHSNEQENMNSENNLSSQNVAAKSLDQFNNNNCADYTSASDLLQGNELLNSNKITMQRCMSFSPSPSPLLFELPPDISQSHSTTESLNLADEGRDMSSLCDDLITSEKVTPRPNASLSEGNDASLCSRSAETMSRTSGESSLPSSERGSCARRHPSAPKYNLQRELVLPYCGQPIKYPSCFRCGPCNKMYASRRSFVKHRRLECGKITRQIRSNHNRRKRKGEWCHYIGKFEDVPDIPGAKTIGIILKNEDRIPTPSSNSRVFKSRQSAPSIYANQLSTCSSKSRSRTGGPPKRESYNDELYQCAECDKSFTVKKSFVRHLLSCGKKSRFKCPMCPATSSRNDSVIRHLRNVHKCVGPFEIT